MKQTFKKILFAVTLIATVGTFSSCNNDDNENSLLIGKWKYEWTFGGGYELLIFYKDGIAQHGEIHYESRQEDWNNLEDCTYTYKDNILTIYFEDDIWVLKVIKLTKSELTIQDEDGVGTLTKIK